MSLFLWDSEYDVKFPSREDCEYHVLKSGGGPMEDREIARVLLNMLLDMDFGDTKPYGKLKWMC